MTQQRRNGGLIGLTVAGLFAVSFGLSWQAGPTLVTPAWAEDMPRTACFALPVDEFSRKASSVLNHLARENYSRSKKFDLIDVREMLNKDAQDPRLQALEKARQLLKEGKNQYDNLELDAAIEVLNKARELFGKAAGRLGDGQDYLDTLLFIGASHILSGDSELGAEAFRTVAMFDKRKNLDPKMFPPSMIEIFNAAKADVNSAPVGTVQMKSNPPAAEVFVNGVFKGITPLTLVKIPEGKHFVRVEMDGYMPWGQQVDFYAAREERVEATLSNSPSATQFRNYTKDVLGDLDDDEPKAALVKLGQWLGVDRLVVISVKQRAEEVTAEAVMISIEPPKKVSFRTETFDMTSANFLARGDAFISSVYRKVKIPPSSGVPKKGTGPKVVANCNSDSDCATGEICDSASSSCIPYAPDKEQFYETWWFWAIVGGGLALGGGAGVMAWYFTRPEQGSIEFSF